MVMVMKNYFEIKIYQFSGLFYLVKMGQNFRARPLPLGKAMPERKPSNLRMRCSQSQAGFTLGEEKGEMSELDIFAEMRLQSVCPGWIWREQEGKSLGGGGGTKHRRREPSLSAPRVKGRPWVDLGGSGQSIGGVRALSETSPYSFGSFHGTPDNHPTPSRAHILQNVSWLQTLNVSCSDRYLYKHIFNYMKTLYTLHGSRFVIKQTTIIKVQPNPTWSDLVILILPFIHDPGDQ